MAGGRFGSIPAAFFAFTLRPVILRNSPSKQPWLDRQPSALGRQRAVAPSHGGGECRNEGEEYRFREENAPDIADSVRSG
jgi:hypothetical protein